MPKVTIVKETKDMFGNNCVPCNEVNYVEGLGENEVAPGSSYYVRTRPSRAYYDESLPTGFRTKRITVLDTVTNISTVYDESMFGGGSGGGSGGGIGGASIGNIQNDTLVTVDFGEGPAQSYSVDTTGAGEGGSIYTSPEPDSVNNDFLQGEKVTVYAVPDDGYELDELKINGESYGDTSVVEYQALDDNLNVEATFKTVYCTENIIQIKRGNNAGLGNAVFYDGELVFNNETKQLRIGIDPDAPASFANCFLLNGSSGSDSGTGNGTINPLTPVNRNCLTVWNDNFGNYIKNATTGAYVEDGLFVKTAVMAHQYGYKLKSYANLATTAYAGIVDCGYPECTEYDHVSLGFVANMIENVNVSQFGGGLLINGHTGSGNCGSPAKYTRVSLAVKPVGVSSYIEALQVLESGFVRCNNGLQTTYINIPNGTYNVGGIPHNHNGTYLPLTGGTLTGSINMGDNRIVGLPTPSLSSEPVTLGYIAGLSMGVIWQKPVISIETEPPTLPVENGRYLVGASGLSGVFSTHANEIAVFEADWTFITPEVSWLVPNMEDGASYIYDGDEWIVLPSNVIHSSLQGLENDDHLQYIHTESSRTIHASHIFASTTPFIVNSENVINHLNADMLDGKHGGDYALVDHGHDWAILAGFQITNPQEGQTLVYDADIGGFVNDDYEGSFTMNPAHQFDTTTERDNYFIAHPSELVSGILVSTGGVFEQYNGSTFEDRTVVLRGPAGTNGTNGVDGVQGEKGDTGEKGDQGIQGPDGIQGPAGSPGTSINMHGSVNTTGDFPTTGNELNDGWYCVADGDCYVYSENNEWVNVGPIVGPRGLQGIQGPQGPQGIQGLRGITGEKGATGSTGPRGEVGPRGPAGIGGESWQPTVEDTVDTPPICDSNDRFLISATPTEGTLFASHPNEIATWIVDEYSVGEWYFDVPKIGWALYDIIRGAHIKFNGAAWVGWTGGGTWGAIAGTLSDQNDLMTALGTKVNTSAIGAVSGVCPLNSSSKIDETYLPSYVDDVVEYANLAAFPGTGESGKIYIAIDTNLPYRWSGSTYVAISSSIALGETSSTAYRGDRGKTAYDHSQAAHAPSDAQKNSDITKEEIEAKLTGTISSHSHSSGTPTAHATTHVTGGSDVIANAVAGGAAGLMSGADKTKLDGIAASANNYSLPTAAADTLGGIKVGSRLTITNGVLSADVQSGAGNVNGPASAVAGNLAALDATGKVLSDSGYDPSDFATAGHTHDSILDESNLYDLPTSPTAGCIVDIVGTGYNWTITATSDTVIHMGATASAVNGSISSTNGYDCVTLVYIGSNKWVVKSAMGILTVV